MFEVKYTFKLAGYQTGLKITPSTDRLTGQQMLSSVSCDSHMFIGLLLGDVAKFTLTLQTLASYFKTQLKGV